MFTRLGTLLALVVVVPLSWLSAKSARATDVGTLLDTCPQHDPAYQQIRNDFEIRREGVVVGDVPCTEPVSQMPLAQYTQELITLQSLRLVLYMDGIPIPWAPGMRLYDWMKSRHAGINIRQNTATSYCCDKIGGKEFFIQKVQDDVTRDGNRDFMGQSGNIALFAHELRHLEGDNFVYLHTSCCPFAQKSKTMLSCDQTYDESNLGSYGIQYWLYSHWLDGSLYTGFSCDKQPPVSEVANWLMQQGANGYLDRFCTNAPPAVTLPAVPGGQCRSPLGAIDLFILVDLSGSFIDDLPVFKAEAPTVIAQLTAKNPNIRIGLGSFQDYPIVPFGVASLGDQAYTRVLDFTADTNLVLSTIAGLAAPGTVAGLDGPESQLPALYQLATGLGQDLTAAGYPGASIPAGQQANFRTGATKLVLLWTDAAFHLPGDAGKIPYPGPDFASTVAALQALDPARVIGLSSGTGAVPDLMSMAQATGALAPAGGVDCEGDGVIDIAAGAPLVCAISSAGTGFGQAVQALVAGAVSWADPIARCQNVTVAAAATTCGTAASIDAGSSDPGGGAVTLQQSPPGPYPPGSNAVTLTAIGPSGQSSTCVATVTVTDGSPPQFAFVPPAITISQCTSPNIGTALATDACGVTVTSNAPTTFHAGQTVVTWTARNPSGNTVTANQTVTAVLASDATCCPVGSHVIQGTSNNDFITGTAGVDCIFGKGGQDTISGLGGNDVISAGDGDDNVSGGDGDDLIYGGQGQDVLNGGNGNDTVNGDDGDDRLNGDAGNDQLFGGQGQDQLAGGAGTDQCVGGAGTNTFQTCEVQQ